MEDVESADGACSDRGPSLAPPRSPGRQRSSLAAYAVAGTGAKTAATGARRVRTQAGGAAGLTAGASAWLEGPASAWLGGAVTRARNTWKDQPW